MLLPLAMLARVKVNHDVRYLGEATPNPLIIDYKILKTAPKSLNIAGIGALLSIHAASFDWQIANKAKKSEFPFDSNAISNGK